MGNIEPLIDGNWKPVEGPDGEMLGKRFKLAWRMASGERGQQELIDPAFRAMPSGCYPRTLLLEVLTQRAGQPAAAAFLYGPRGIRIVSGQSSMLHDLNEETGLVLDSAERAEAYLRLFCNMVHGDEGRFQLIERAGQLESCGAALPDPTIIAPLAAVNDADGWQLKSVVRYGSSLFRSRFRLERNGIVEMTDDEPLETLSSDPPERFEFPFRIAAGAA